MLGDLSLPARPQADNSATLERKDWGIFLGQQQQKAYATVTEEGDKF